MNFLIDECLHTSLVEVAEARGHQATHVNFRGWSGRQDWNLMPEILGEGFTFVTNNAKDFRRLYAQAEIHEGLVILIPNVPPAEQRSLFDAVLDNLAEAPGLINEALEVEVVDGEVQITRYELPQDTPDEA